MNRKPTYEELEKDLKRYRSLVENVEEMIYEVDADGICTYVSPGITNMLGYEPEELLGKVAVEFMPPDERKRVYKLFREGSAVPAPYPFGTLEFKRIHKNGEYLTCESSGKPFFNSDGELLGFRGVERNITERKRAEDALRESEERNRATLNAITDTAVLLDKEGIILAINKAGAEKLRMSVDNLVGTRFYDYFSPELAAAIQEAIRSSKPVRREYESEGISYDQYIYPWFGKNGNVRGVAAFLIDVTQRRQAEIELRERKKQLEEKTQELEQLNTALEVLLKKREKDKSSLEERVLFSIEELVKPYLEKLRKSGLNQNQNTFLGVVESSLNDITSPFVGAISDFKLGKLTPTEIQVANLVKQGKTSQEIAELLCLSKKTIDSHRDNIREKVGIRNKKMNLRSYLLSAE